MNSNKKTLLEIKDGLTSVSLSLENLNNELELNDKRLEHYINGNNRVTEFKRRFDEAGSDRITKMSSLMLLDSSYYSFGLSKENVDINITKQDLDKIAEEGFGDFLSKIGSNIKKILGIKKLKYKEVPIVARNLKDQLLDLKKLTKEYDGDVTKPDVGSNMNNTLPLETVSVRTITEYLENFNKNSKATFRDLYITTTEINDFIDNKSSRKEEEVIKRINKVKFEDVGSEKSPLPRGIYFKFEVTESSFKVTKNKASMGKIKNVETPTREELVDLLDSAVEILNGTVLDADTYVSEIGELYYEIEEWGDDYKKLYNIAKGLLEDGSVVLWEIEKSSIELAVAVTEFVIKSLND